MRRVPETAMVLAAGLGLRMRPLTERVPKPMIRLGRKLLIDHVLDRLAEAGVAQAVVNVHYRADQIDRHLSTRRAPRIQISDERDELLDTGGGIAKALPWLGSEPFLIHNSDSLWLEDAEPNLGRLARAFDGHRMDGLLLLAPAAGSLGYEGRGDFLMESDGRLQHRPEGGRAPLVYTGVSIVHPRLFADAPQGPFSLNLLWDRALAGSRLFGVRLEGAWMHVGTPSALAEAELAMSGAHAR